MTSLCSTQDRGEDPAGRRAAGPPGPSGTGPGPMLLGPDDKAQSPMTGVRP